jgi:transposase
MEKRDKPDLDNLDLDTYPSWLVPEEGIPPFSEIDWRLTPKAVRALLLAQHRQLAALEDRLKQLQSRVEHLESRLRRDSHTSDKPPSSDSPFRKKGKKKRGKAGGKKGHRGHKQQMLEPGRIVGLKPETCGCGHGQFEGLRPYYTHQVIELPEIAMEVTHYVLHEGRCGRCGQLNKARLPQEHQSGYGPRFTALIGEVAGIQGNSRATIQEFCSSVLGISISKGAIQKVIRRVSVAVKSHYEAIGQVARRAPVNHIDETSWFQSGALMWLWVMVNTTVAFFMVHPRRSKEALAALIDDWVGILVSDGYGVYQQWVALRQTCLAHLIRKAKALAAGTNPEVAGFGRHAQAELERLCHMAHTAPTIGQWRAFYARFTHLISRHHDRRDATGTFARRLLREMDSLWVFLEVQGVEPTNNRAERALRPGVQWRKRSLGTESDHGNRWVERILSLRQTCRLRNKATFPVLVEAVEASFKGHIPDLTWIAQH